MINVELFFDVPFEDPRSHEAIVSLPEWQFDPTAEGSVKVKIPPTSIPANIIKYPNVVQFVLNMLVWKTSLPDPVEIHVSGGSS